MNEFEIKFLFPEEKLIQIESYLIANGGTRRQHLQAAYIDTPDFLLSRAAIAFRLRREGRQWIQTLKVATSNMLERLEHNVVISAAGKDLPTWDIRLHQNHKAGKRLNKLLSKSNTKDLRVVYQTDIWRRKALVHTQSGTIEYALDCGNIFAERSTGITKVSVQELEIELKDGSSETVLNQAKQVIREFNAHIDTRSKSERGFLLASDLTFSPPQKASYYSLNHAASKAEIIRILIDSCMSQILSNQSILNAGVKDYSEYLHQLRIGLRRLKVIFKYLPNLDNEISQESIVNFKSVFSGLGQYRDAHFVTEFLNPILISLGGPEVVQGELPRLSHPSTITRDINFQIFLLEAMRLSLEKSKGGLDDRQSNCKHQDELDFKKFVNTQLTKIIINFTKKVSNFKSLKDAEIHELRKKMKFMRYSLDFFNEYLDQKRLPSYYKRTSELLQHFGFFNDICVAIKNFDVLVKDDSNLLFALGWLKGERERVKTVCHKSAKSLLKCEAPWKM
ncbi:MAG: CHAD domain-containing protein [Polynucleobacter sp.]